MDFLRTHFSSREERYSKLLHFQSNHLTSLSFWQFMLFNIVKTLKIIKNIKMVLGSNTLSVLNVNIII